MKTLENGHLRIKTNEYMYKERNMRLKEQSIDGINNNSMMTKIITRPTTIKNNNK